jgi:hypothetical protein
LSIGSYVLVIPVIATVILLRHRASLVGVPGLVTGGSLPVFYVAYLNRAGPGTICRAIASGQECSQEWSPWPWLAVGLALFLGGLVWYVGRRRRAAAAVLVPPRPDR